MRSGDIPFKFDLTDLVARARRQISGRVGNITLSLPFISIEVSPKDRERQVAREIVLRLRDRRVLSAWECCDSCIDNALASLREIRQLIVDKEVELADLLILEHARQHGHTPMATFDRGFAKVDGTIRL